MGFTSEQTGASRGRDPPAGPGWEGRLGLVASRGGQAGGREEEGGHLPCLGCVCVQGPANGAEGRVTIMWKRILASAARVRPPPQQDSAALRATLQAGPWRAPPPQLAAGLLPPCPSCWQEAAGPAWWLGRGAGRAPTTSARQEGRPPCGLQPPGKGLPFSKWLSCLPLPACLHHAWGGSGPSGRLCLILLRGEACRLVMVPCLLPPVALQERRRWALPSSTSRDPARVSGEAKAGLVL